MPKNKQSELFFSETVHRVNYEKLHVTRLFFNRESSHEVGAEVYETEIVETL